MLEWAIGFFIVSIIAGVFGFRGVASTSKSIAKFLFFLFVILFILTLLFGSAIL